MQEPFFPTRTIQFVWRTAAYFSFSSHGTRNCCTKAWCEMHNATSGCVGASVFLARKKLTQSSDSEMTYIAVTYIVFQRSHLVSISAEHFILPRVVLFVDTSLGTSDQVEQVNQMLLASLKTCEILLLKQVLLVTRTVDIRCLELKVCT